MFFNLNLCNLYPLNAAGINPKNNEQALLLLCVMVTFVVAKEVPLPSIKGSIEAADDRVGIMDIFKSIKNLPPGMLSVLLVTSLTWVCCPFLPFKHCN